MNAIQHNSHYHKVDTETNKSYPTRSEIVIDLYGDNVEEKFRDNDTQTKDTKEDKWVTDDWNHQIRLSKMREQLHEKLKTGTDVNNQSPDELDDVTDIKLSREGDVDNEGMNETIETGREMNKEKSIQTKHGFLSKLEDKLKSLKINVFAYFNNTFLNHEYIKHDRNLMKATTNSKKQSREMWYEQEDGESYSENTSDENFGQNQSSERSKNDGAFQNNSTDYEEYLLEEVRGYDKTEHDEAIKKIAMKKFNVYSNKQNSGDTDTSASKSQNTSENPEHDKKPDKTKNSDKKPEKAQNKKMMKYKSKTTTPCDVNASKIIAYRVFLIFVRPVYANFTETMKSTLPGGIPVAIALPILTLVTFMIMVASGLAFTEYLVTGRWPKNIWFPFYRA